MAATSTATDPTARSAAANPPGPKLRDSCHGCAASKLKCSKEKPTCVRCEKRGITCEYFTTKRAGRKKGSRPKNQTQNQNQNQNQNNPLPAVLSHQFPPPTWPAVAWPDLFTAHVLGQLQSNQQMQNHDIQHGFFAPSNDPTTASTPNTLNAHFEEFLASPISFSALTTPELGEPNDSSRQLGLDQDNDHPMGSFPDDHGHGSLLPDDAFGQMDQAAGEFTSVSQPQTPKITQPQDTNMDDLDSSFPCPCLMRALGLLKQLFPTSSRSCQSSGEPVEGQNLAGQQQLPTIKSVIADNKQTLETIGSILECPCSQDGYLLVILSLIVFKVMGWYAAAARSHTPDDSQSWTACHQQQHSHSEQVQQSPAVVGSYCVEGEDQSRMAAQLVLSELHRVQRLVNILSQRLKTEGARESGTDTPGSTSADGSGVSLDSQCSRFPFPVTMLDQAESDLRKRLRRLSAEIVEMLRCG